MLHSVSGSGVFYPFPHEGSIFTFDSSLWRSGNSCGSVGPVAQTVVDELERGRLEKVETLLAVTDQPDWIPPGATRAVPLSMIEEVKSACDLEIVPLGFDVIDFQTGISGLTNIGLGSDEVEQFQRCVPMVNEHGLVPDSATAERLAALASLVAPEHAPFFLVHVLKARLAAWSLHPGISQEPI